MCVHNNECVCNSARLRLEVSFVCMCHGKLHFSSYCAVQVSACGSAISLRLVLRLHVACDDTILPLL